MEGVYIVEWEDEVTGERGAVVCHSSYAWRKVVDGLRAVGVTPRSLCQCEDGSVQDCCRGRGSGPL